MSDRTLLTPAGTNVAPGFAGVPGGGGIGLVALRKIVPVPRLWIGPIRFPANLLSSPTTVRLHRKLAMLRPYLWVFGVWLSVAVFPVTTLSSQVIDSNESMRIPSRAAA